MRRLLLGLLLLSGCTGAPVVKAPEPPPPPPPASNFVLTLYEVVANPEEDAPVFAEVFVDGQPAGRTPEAARSQPKSWGAVLPEGNRLLKFVVQDSTSAWNADYQPRERFYRVEPGMRTSVVLKYYDRGRKHSLSVDKQPLP